MPTSSSAPSDPVPAPSGQELPPGTRLEEFTIERVLGSGGFGITYLAKDERLGRRVVVKENLPVQFAFRDPSTLAVSSRSSSGDDAGMFRDSLENFQREAETLASLDHPGIVPILRSFEARGTAYFVMPFLEGESLKERIRRRADGPAFGEEELLGLLRGVLDALVYLHDRGIYHRDIKPDNILVAGKGSPVLIDFGAARQRLGERSLTVIESPGYTPFEQLQSRGKIGPWSDLYALGGTLHTAITGETPPKATDRAFDDPREPLTKRAELRGRYSEAFLASIDKAMATRHQDRFRDAGEWLEALPGNGERLPEAGGAREVKEVKAVEAEVKAGGPGGHLRPLPAGAAEVAKGIVRVVRPIMDRAVKAPKGTVSNRKGIPWNEAGIAIGIFLVVLLAVIFFFKGEASRDSVERPGVVKASRDPMQGRQAGEVREFGGIEMVWCPPGEFWMGSPEGEEGRGAGEARHRVALRRGFWLSKTETTQTQWEAAMGSNPSYFKGAELPVEQVSWDDIQVWLGTMNERHRPSSDWKWDLPTEAQWEYACRAGTVGAYAGELGEMAWYESNSGGQTNPVGTKRANGWGLHDLHGNVWEWCRDRHGDYRGSATDPSGPASGVFRVYRGGSWRFPAARCRSADRLYGMTGNQSNTLGFRPALVPSTSR